jgi:hypothetical protein
MTREIIEPPVPSSYKLKSVAELLEPHADKLAAMGLSVESDPVSEEDRVRYEKAAWKRVAAHVADMPPRIRAIVNHYCNGAAAKGIEKFHADRAAKRQELDKCTDDWKEERRIEYRLTNCISNVFEVSVDTALDWWFARENKDDRTTHERAVKDRMVTLIVGGADPVIVMRETAKAIARGNGEGPQAYPARFFECRDYYHWAIDADDPHAVLGMKDYDLIGELMVRRYGITDSLVFGTATGKFYVGDREIPRVVIEGMVRDTLATITIVNDDRDGEPVQADRRLRQITAVGLSDRRRRADAS